MTGVYKGKRKEDQQSNTVKEEIERVAAGRSSEVNGPPRPYEPRVPIPERIDDVRQAILDLLGNPPDLGFREFWFGTGQPVRCLSVYIDGVTDPVSVAGDLLQPLMEIPYISHVDMEVTHANAFDLIHERLSSTWILKTLDELGQAVSSMLAGVVLLFVEGQSKCMMTGRRDTPGRDVQEPRIQQVIRGPREAFTETIRDNTGLVRKRITHASLRIERINIGRLTNTIVDLVWIQGLANDKLVQEARVRLNRIDIDAIFDSGYVEELIEDQPWSPFPTVYNTERPDTFCASLVEGRVGILVDGSPEGLVIPGNLVMFFQSAEDYYERFHITILTRGIRLIAAFISLLLPTIYVAATTFHHELIPTALLLSIAAGRESVPFPAAIEALLMIFTFEIVREAGVRLPGVIGQAVSIVGALVIGQAVVSAGIVSPIMVVIIALTEISSFALPFYDMGATLRILRYPLILLAATLGIFGIVIGVLAIIIHLCGVRSFGDPYFVGLAPIVRRDVKDIFIRVPWPAMKWRPRLPGQRYPQRQGPSSGPKRPKRKGRKE